MIQVIERNGFKHELATAKLHITFTQKINGVPVYIVIMGVEVGFQVDCGQEVGDKVKSFIEGMSSDFEFVARFTDLIKVMLTVDVKLFDVVVEILTRLKSGLEYDARIMTEIMASAMIKDNGNGFLSIWDGKGWLSIEILAPFSSTGIFLVTRDGESSEALNGVNDLFVKIGGETNRS
jgi:hypothetical protein